MTRKERLHALMKGQEYDRPPFNFYEINGIVQRPDDPDSFNVYTDPSWLPLLQMAREKTDIILLDGADYRPSEPVTNKKKNYTEYFDSYYDEKGSLHTVYKLEIDGRTLTRRTRRDRDVNTVWTTEHLLKDEDDLIAWLKLPDKDPGIPDCSRILQHENILGEDGIVAPSIGDALCNAAELFSMEDYTIIAMTNPELFKQALDKVQRTVISQLKAAVRELPGRMWRICGSEYAGVPYLPPRLYDEYVTNYDSEIMSIIHESGGCPRVHQHGNIKSSLDSMVKMGVWGTDPIEPPGQGDVTLKYVREKYGDQLVLFGNLEASDIETLSPDAFEEKITTALNEGVSASGGGFLLQPSACPYGRKLSDVALNNYKRWIEVMERRYPGTL